METTTTPRKRRLKWWQIALITFGGVVLLVWAIGAIAGAAGYQPEEAQPAPAQTKTPQEERQPPAEEEPEKPAKDETPKPAPEPQKIDRGQLLYSDITAALEAAGDEAAVLRMYAVTGVDDEGTYLRVNYQNGVSNDEDAEDIAREIYGFTMSDAFEDGERTALVIRDASGKDWNVWVTREGSLAQFSTSAWG